MTLLDSAKEGRRFVALLLSVGILQIAGYWLAGSLVNGPGPLASAQPDTLLYCQAAARVAEGHPFSYSEGSAVCTGTTSVLYPFVLAVPHLLGFRGASLVSAGFWLNALFYLLFLVGWGAFAWKTFHDPLLRLVCGAGLALFPGTAYCALAQSDVGMWLAVSGLFAGALAFERRVMCAALLVLAPWVRPEGIVCAAAFLAVGVWRWRREGRRGDAVVAALGILSVCGVFALNHALTGHFQFSSVANKGYLATEPFPMAVQKTACDFMRILKDLAFGQSVAPPRMFYSIPLLGGLLIWLGVAVHDWRRRGVASQCVLFLSALGGILTVAQSGWQNTNVDRYLAWVMPVFVIFAAEGGVWAYRLLKDHTAAAWLAIVLPLAFSALASVAFFFLFFACSEESERIPSFGRDLDVIMPQRASYGVTGWCGLAATLPGRRCAHLGGIYSPEFSAKTLQGNLEILRNEPHTRFDFWVFAADDKFPPGFKELQRKQIAVGPEGVEVCHADWAAFDFGLVPRPEGASADELKGLALVERLDVGYEKDEMRLDYEIVPKYHLRPFGTIARVDSLTGKKVFDVGRVIYGEDEMTVPLAPGKDVKLVMRTISNVDLASQSMVSPSVKLKYAYSDPLELHIEIDGREVGHSHAHMAKEGFTDAVFTIPGKAITHSPCRISLHGDHVAFGYWFYQ